MTDDVTLITIIITRSWWVTVNTLPLIASLSIGGQKWWCDSDVVYHHRCDNNHHHHLITLSVSSSLSSDHCIWLSPPSPLSPRFTISSIMTVTIITHIPTHHPLSLWLWSLNMLHCNSCIPCWRLVDSPLILSVWHNDRLASLTMMMKVNGKNCSFETCFPSFIFIPSPSQSIIITFHVTDENGRSRWWRGVTRLLPSPSIAQRDPHHYSSLHLSSVSVMICFVHCDKVDMS